MMDLNGLKTKLEEQGQGHLVKFWDTLNEEERTTLYKDLSAIDLSEVSKFIVTWDYIPVYKEAY